MLLDVRGVVMIFQCYAWFSTELASNKHLGKHSRTYFQMDASDACAFSSPSAPSTLACPAACGLSSWHSASKLSSRLASVDTSQPWYVAFAVLVCFLGGDGGRHYGSVELHADPLLRNGNHCLRDLVPEH